MNRLQRLLATGRALLASGARPAHNLSMRFACLLMWFVLPLAAADSQRSEPAAPAAPVATVAATPAAADPAVPVAPPAPEAPPTLEERFTASAPETAPPDRVFAAILPGTTVAELAQRLGRPSRINESGTLAEVRWDTGPGPRDPWYVVWLRGDIAVRMRFLDR